MLFDIPFLTDWKHIREFSQKTERNTERENNACVDWGYQPGYKVLLQKDGILRKYESLYESDPWTTHQLIQMVL